jgi:hypothetical protein
MIDALTNNKFLKFQWVLTCSFSRPNSTVLRSSSDGSAFQKYILLVGKCSMVHDSHPLPILAYMVLQDKAYFYIQASWIVQEQGNLLWHFCCIMCNGGVYVCAVAAR